MTVEIVISPFPTLDVADDETAPKMESRGLLRLNVGCGPLRYKGETGIDKYVTPGMDVQADILDGLPYGDGVAEFVRLDHILEHLPFAAASRALLEARRVLTDGGYLRVGVPDLAAVMRTWLETTKLYEKSILLRNLYGMQIHEGEFHKSGYDAETLRDILAACGFDVLSVGDDAGRDETLTIVAWAVKE